MVDEDDKHRPKKIVTFGRSDNTRAHTDEEPEATDLVAITLQEWTQARESLARLESRLESSQEDVSRAVEYARELENECDRIATASRRTEQTTDQVRSELDEERGRRRELEEQYQFIVDKLEKMSGIRGRYHLERNRREDAEETNRKLSIEIEQLAKTIEALTHALEEAKERGLKAELGPLSVELKR